MPTHRRLKSKDEELGKRDDDFRPRVTDSSSTNATRPWRWRKRRIVAVFAGIALLYFFSIKIFGILTPIEERFGMELKPGHVGLDTPESREPSGPAPRKDSTGKADEGQGAHYYEGPIKYYRLASSLNKITKTLGSRPENRNVLFAASSLKSVANIMPLACKMAKWKRNYVHLAVLGRDPLSLDTILEINGVSKESCPAYFHDARSDYAEFSTDERAEVAVLGAMKHINDFMHPQAIIVDDRTLEDSFFNRAIQKKAKDLRRALIEVPDGKYEDFLWLTKLDSGSLASWHRPTVDILIHAPRGSSGSLIRLIRSLEQADYTGLKAPRLSIELPSDIEPFAMSYLERLDWPPEKSASPLKTNSLTLRHRIPTSKVTPDQASLRFLESFYPTNPDDNHVLVVSPQAELSPLYFQYLYYLTLEYQYSSHGSSNAGDLLGISLDVPSTYINGSGDFIPPIVADMNSKKYTSNEQLDQSSHTPFLYEAPSSTANLIFGDKWATLHNFLSNRLTATYTGKAEKSKKFVSETEPAWLEYLLELMRARSWSLLHPSSSLVTVHNELARIPEEYMRDQTKDPKTAEEHEPVEPIEDAAFLTAPNPPVIQEHVEQETKEGLLPLLDMLPFDGDLPELHMLPYMYHTGDLISQDTAVEFRDRYIPRFRRQLGGCQGDDADRKRIARYLRTEDLFCLPGIEPEYDEKTKEDEADEKKAEEVVKETEPSAGEGEKADESTNEAGGDAEEPVRATVETKEEMKAQEEAASDG